MSDLALVGLWLAVLCGGIGVCVAARAAGLATTHVRDLLHVGSGVWVLGWPYWSSPVWPAAIVLVAAAAVAAVPWLSRRVRWLGRFERSISDGDERWMGVALYTGAFAVMTCAGLWGRAFPAAAALLALSLGDGIGGAVGRRFGRHRYRLPWGKQKSLEGSAAVAVLAAAGGLIAALWLAVPVTAAVLLGIGLVAAAAEAAAPRASDNLAIPAAVWIFLTLLA
jgi:phytol kinase